MSTIPSSRTGTPQTSKMQLGRVLGPIFALAAYFLLPAGLPETARLTAAAATLMATFWITEAIPLSATALLPIVLFPVLGIVDSSQAAAPFAKPVIFLFLGGFMMAMAVERCGLHRRIALAILRLTGGTPNRLLAGFMAATAFLSMWISNTATTVMMVPIASSLIGMVPGNDLNRKSRRRFELCLLLGIAYSASIGGLGTLVGTPPNALLVGFLHEKGFEIGFGQWMLIAVPLVIVFLVVLWFVLCKIYLDARIQSISIDQSVIDEQYGQLGPVTRSEWTVLSVFLVAATLWIFRQPLTHIDWLVQACPWIGRLNDASISVGAAIALFLLPVNNHGDRALDWQSANRLPWGVLILLGGGMSLATAMDSSGLNAVIAEQLQILQSLPPVLLMIAVTGLVIFLTEVTSNTATTAALLPVLFGLGANVAGGPLVLLVPATLAASCAFMLPVATAPNAVVFGTGRVPMIEMIRSGLWLNLIGIVLIPIVMIFLGCTVLDISL